MKLTTLLSLFVAAMLGLAIGGAGLSIWSANKSAHHLKQMDLATQVYAGNLKLSTHTYQLFKLFGDVLIVGRQDMPDSKLALMQDIRDDISDIRQLIGQEIDLIGESEIVELRELAELEVQIERLFTELIAITATGAAGDIPDKWNRLSNILEGGADDDFQLRIHDALEEEAGEVEEIRIASARMLDVHRRLSMIFGVLALACSALGMFALNRLLWLRVAHLREGATLMSLGKFSHRIDVSGSDEVTELGDILNTLADAVNQREAALRVANENLEGKVQSRTEQLENLLDEVKSAETNRKRLIADVSHELRTPLTVIRGEADVALRGDKEPDTYREALTIVREAASHTARLVDDLLFVARSEASEVRLKLAQEDLLNIILSVLRSGSHGVDLITDLDRAPLRCDAGRIRQALVILLENARQYGGKSIRIRVDSNPGGYRVAVEDDGPGMSQAEKDNAFERFFRGSNAAQGYDDGAGLGLPVAKSIVEAHGGVITLNDREEGGLAATITLRSVANLRSVS